jgi:hypothetical protein
MMLTLQLDAELETSFYQLAQKEQLLPEQLFKKLIANYTRANKEPELLADIMLTLPQINCFNDVNFSALRDSFWQTKTLKQLEEQQGNKTFKKSTVYQADFLPETETTDDWLHYFAVQHQQDKAGL